MDLILALILIANFYALGIATGRNRACRTSGHTRRAHRAVGS